MPPDPDTVPRGVPIIPPGMAPATFLHEAAWTEARREAEPQLVHLLSTQTTASPTPGRCRSHRERDAEIRGRSVAPNGHRSQHITEGYAPTLPSTSSRSSRRSRTFNSGPTYTYLPPSRSGMVSEVASNASSSTVTHTFAYDNSGVTHTWHPPPRHQFPQTSNRSSRSHAPSTDSRVSRSQAMSGAHGSVASDGTRLPPRSFYGYPPPPTPMLRGRSRSNFSSISSAMEAPAYDSDVEHPFS